MVNSHLETKEYMLNLLTHIGITYFGECTRKYEVAKLCKLSDVFGAHMLEYWQHAFHSGLYLNVCLFHALQ